MLPHTRFSIPQPLLALELIEWEARGCEAAHPKRGPEASSGVIECGIESRHLPTSVGDVSARTHRVLAVDDEPAIRDLLVRALGMAEYEVVAGRDGEAGLVAAQGAEPPYDLVVTNSYMPGLGREEPIGQMRKLYPRLSILHLDDLAHPIGPNVSSVSNTRKWAKPGTTEVVAGLHCPSWARTRTLLIQRHQGKRGV